MDSYHISAQGFGKGQFFVTMANGLLLNCVEIYARLPSLDSHFERFKITRNQLSSSSLLGANGRFENVLVTVMNNDNSNKLVIGTKMFNVLATSTFRLDIDATPLVGASSINGFQPTKATQIFLHRKLSKELQDFAENSVNIMYINKPLYNFDDYSQLRQVRSKFHDPSTCLYRRASNDLRLRPVTIWTLADADTNNPTVSAGRLASRLFQKIARCVWNEQELDYASVNSIQCNTDSKIKNALCDICDLFKTSQYIPILGSKHLNGHFLTHLADIMSPHLTNANKEVALGIVESFN